MLKMILLLLLLFVPSPIRAETHVLLTIDETYPINISASAYGNLGNGSIFHCFLGGDFRYQCDNVGGGSPDDCNSPCVTDMGLSFPPGTLKNFSFTISPNDTTCIVESFVEVNDATSNLGCAITNTTPDGLTRATCSDTTDSVTVAAGDKIRIYMGMASTCTLGSNPPGTTRQGVAGQVQVEFVY